MHIATGKGGYFFSRAENTVITFHLVSIVKYNNTYNRPEQIGNTYGNTEHVYMQNGHHFHYDRSYNSGKPERVSMPIDYDRRNYRNSQI